MIVVMIIINVFSMINGDGFDGFSHQCPVVELEILVEDTTTKEYMRTKNNWTTERKTILMLNEVTLSNTSTGL